MLYHSRLIGLVGFEPTASSSRTRRSTKLSHSPSYSTSMVYDEACSSMFLLSADFVHFRSDRARNLPGTEAVLSSKSASALIVTNHQAHIMPALRGTAKRFAKASRLRIVCSPNVGWRTSNEKCLDCGSKSERKRGAENPWVSYCEAATEFNVAQDAVKTYAGSQPNALTSVPGLQRRIVTGKSRRCLVRVNGCLQCSWQF